LTDQRHVPVPPSLADGRWRALDPRYVPCARIGGAGPALFQSVMIFGAMLGAILIFELPRWTKIALGPAWLLATLVLLLWTMVWPGLSYRAIRYRLDEQSFEISRGVFWRELITVPRSRIQHTDVSQGPLQRHFGIATLIVYTAGTVNASVHLSGLAHPTALTMRDHLVRVGDGDAV